MIEFGESSSFQRAYKRLMDNPFEPTLQTHKLGGRMRHQWAYTLTRKLRIVFTFTRPDFALLEDIGSHDQVY